MYPGDVQHGVVDPAVFEAAVAKDLPGRHVREDVLDVGADPLVRRVVCFLPVRKVFALAPQYDHQLAQQARTQPGERGRPGRPRSRGHTSHPEIIPLVTGVLCTAVPDGLTAP